MANPAPPQVQRAVRTPDPGRAGKLTDNCEPTQSEISEVLENSKENESKSDDFEKESKVMNQTQISKKMKVNSATKQGAQLRYWTLENTQIHKVSISEVGGQPAIEERGKGYLLEPQH